MRCKPTQMSGHELNWAVTLIEMERTFEQGGFVKGWVRANRLKGESVDAYAEDWLWGGPLIEREGIAIEMTTMVGEYAWEAKIRVSADREECAYGRTPLVAAMRAFVATQSGETFEFPQQERKVIA